MNKKLYITTPIYYANDVPHIGHLFTTTFADALARYYRKQLGSENVYFTTGLDEHGTTVEESAKKKGYPDLQKFVDERAEFWQKAFNDTNISYDYFVRTTHKDHVKFSQNFIRKMVKAGDIYQGTYKGKYCYGCEKFLTMSDQNEDGFCPLHRPDQVIDVKEKNYYFKLSKYAPKVKELIESGEIDLKPESKKNEILARIAQGVEDQSISRPISKVSWAVEFPDDSEQGVYVWVEALLNYLSSLEINNKRELWDGAFHIVGKEINWFHNVIWPAMLLSAGYPLYKRSFVHSFINIGGRKISKSLGNVISPAELISKYGIDGSRYLLLANTPYKDDIDITWEALDARYNSDLANGLGNLVSRTAKLAGAISGLPLKGLPLSDEVKKAYEELRFQDVISEIQKLVKEANEYLDARTPWKLEGKERDEVIKEVIKKILKIAFVADPIIPKTAEKIKEIFSASKIEPTEALFKRI